MIVFFLILVSVQFPIGVRAESNDIILFLITVRDDPKQSQIDRDQARAILAKKRQEYLQILEDGKEENLKAHYYSIMRVNVFETFAVQFVEWDDRRHRIEASKTMYKRIEAVEMLSKMDFGTQKILAAIVHAYTYDIMSDVTSAAQSSLEFMVLHPNSQMIQDFVALIKDEDEDISVRYNAAVYVSKIQTQEATNAVAELKMNKNLIQYISQALYIFQKD